MDAGEVAYSQVAEDMERLEEMIEDVQQTMHRFYGTEQSDKREERVYVTSNALERKIDAYADEAEAIAASYGEVEVTAARDEDGYLWQWAVAEEVAKLENRAFFLQRLRTAYPDALEGLEELPTLY